MTIKKRCDVYDMPPEKLYGILSKFQMPEGEYVASKGDEFGESEFYWMIENKNTHSKYLLVNTYSHPSSEKEMSYYRKNGFNVKQPILRKIETLDDPNKKNDSEWNYLFSTYAIFIL